MILQNTVNLIFKRITAILLIFSVCLLQNASFFALEAEENIESSVFSYIKDDADDNKIQKYNADLTNAVKLENGAEIKDSFLHLVSGSKATLNINIENPDEYVFYIKYKAIAGFGGNVEIEFLVDNKLPFKDADCLTFPRLYSQSEILTNSQNGDDVQPLVSEFDVWQERYAYDNTGFFNEPYSFSINSGAHTITLSSLRGTIIIAEVGFIKYTKSPKYKEYASEFLSGADKGIGETIIQAEKLDYKTDTTVLPKNDFDSVDTVPQSASNKLLNTLGGSIWKTPRSAVTYKFNIEKDGIYYISMRYNQGFTDGIFSSRKVLIDGKAPFAEFENLRFDYTDDWKEITLGDGVKPYGVYLTSGEHTITFEAVVGDLASYLNAVNECLNKLNIIYREIVKITGTSPDIYRDYGFEKLIPDEIEDMQAICNELSALEKRIVEIAGVDAGYTALIDKIVFQMKKMTEKPKNLAKYLTSFKSNLGSLATWVLDSTHQPLQLDWIYIGENQDYSCDKKSFFEKIKHGILRLLTSYSRDYNFVGVESNEATEEVVVWTATGRDQAEIIRQLVATRFCKENSVTVKLQVVAGGTLLPALAAGTGPDVSMDNASSDPINYAIRGAVADLTQFKDFKEVSKRFFEGSVEPFIFEGKAYALPQTYSFPMFFYRKDIFEEYGWSIPQTLEEIKTFAAELQSKDMNMSMPPNQIGYGTILYQNSGSFYEENGKRTALDSNLALSCFEEYMKYFTLYTLPAAASFVNRFRTGEMPCGIEDYSTYNTLIVYAPEISGSWEMVPIPGTLKEDGTIDRSTVGTATGTIITEQCKNKETAWNFVKWWLSEDIQSEYGKNLESVLGAAAKYNTANINALKKMTWSYQEYNALIEQANWSRAIPEVPGGYYLARTFNFAFNRSYNSSTEQSVAEEPTEVMKEYIDELNSELARKRKEFGLED